jgi:hypothetical protein
MNASLTVDKDRQSLVVDTTSPMPSLLHRSKVWAVCNEWEISASRL